MRELAVLFLHPLATVARLAGRGGVRAAVAESVRVKQQLLILNRSRNVAGACTLLMRPSLAGPFRHRLESRARAAPSVLSPARPTETLCEQDSKRSASVTG
jgi:hypothetical protein